MKEDIRVASTERIGREIELLQARVHARKNGKAEPLREEEIDGQEGVPK